MQPRSSLSNNLKTIFNEKEICLVSMKGRKETSDEYSNHYYEGARCIFVLQRLSHLFWKVQISTKAGMISSGIIEAFHRLFNAQSSETVNIIQSI